MIKKRGVENSLSCVLSLAYYSAQDTYAVYRELQGGEGFADLVFIPRTGNSNAAMIIELKWNQNAGIALNQIKDRQYIKYQISERFLELVKIFCKFYQRLARKPPLLKRRMNCVPLLDKC